MAQPSWPLQSALRPVVGVAVLTSVAIGLCVGYPCFSTGFRYGLWLEQCPASDLRLAVDVNAYRLLRGGEGTVKVQPIAIFLPADSDVPTSVMFSRGAVITAEIQDLESQVVSGATWGRFKREGGGVMAPLTLPDLPDGDYKIHVRVETAFESTEVSVPLALYAPAVVHMVTDRPLYKPGQDVQIRSVLLKQTDLTPLDGRPGTWKILAPDRTEMHVERAKAGAFGVASTSFPLDRFAEVGVWTAQYESGGVVDEVQFDVRPFKLPRLSVEATAKQPWFSVGDSLAFSGVARYASGAPVANAPVRVHLRQASGRWPMPLAWHHPIEAITGEDGRFNVEVGQVPADLLERAEIMAQIEVTEAAGEMAQSAARLVLSLDDLQVQTVTELGDGLVENFNNRAYLRVSTPDGVPLRNTDLVVDNPWDPTAPKRKATTDVDGVAALQLDPGPPVTVMIPAPPVRVRPLQPNTVQIQSATELSTQRGLSMDERKALDTVRIPDSLRSSLTLGNQQDVGGSQGVASAVERAALSGRRCLQLGEGTSSAVFDVHWALRQGSLKPTLEVTPLGQANLSSSTVRCLRTAVLGAVVSQKATADSVGTVRLSLNVPRSPGVSKHQAQASVGYELRVSAVSDGAQLGQTRTVLPVGAVPSLRMRATPSLAHAGDTVDVELFRGGDGAVSLPEKLWLREGQRYVQEEELTDNKVSFTLPDDAEGFLYVAYGGARAVIFVQPAAPLSLELSTEAASYRPGTQAKLHVKTLAGDQPVSAGVGLMGVDSTLGQLASLVGPDDWGRVTVRATSDQPAFGAFDPRALTLGQVRGEHAAKAAVLRISQLPMDEAGDVRLSVNGAVRPKIDETLVTNFYRGYEAMVPLMRDWERTAADSEKVDPKVMADIWTSMLAEQSGAGTAVVDGWGRPLTLDVIPQDLLIQLDPHQVVVDGTRLPEDVVSWERWVATEVR